jgi:hypothetical protein
MIFEFNQAGQPITMDAWLVAFANTEFRTLGLEWVGDALVSTVWVGVDLDGEDPPLIFESMVFGGPLDHTTWRYATRDEAVAGHAELIKRVSAEVQP